MNNANTCLAKNTVIYFIGNFGSKVLQFFILPLLTSILLTEEYGYYDLVITTINLVLPLVTLQLIEAIFRFLFDENTDKKKEIVTSVSLYLIFGSILLGVIIFLVNKYIVNIQFPLLVYLNFISCIIFNYLQRMARSTKKNLSVAISGIINTVVMLGIQCVALYIFNMRVDGLLIANMVAHFVAALYLQKIVKIQNYFDIRLFSKKTLLEMLKYSLPLVPNSVCWWLVSACDKYVISFFISVAANGIYSIAGKFSQMLTMITGVFQMAWQESSIMESNSTNRNEFYSNVFDMYVRFLFCGFIVLLPFIRLIMPYLVAESFQSGYLYSPILLIGSVFAAFSQFYGSAYLAFKKTGGAFSTTIIAVVVNVIIGVGFVKFFGVFAPALGTAVSFLVQWLLRKHQMKSYFCLNIDKKLFLFLTIISMIYIILYYSSNVFLHCILFVIGAVIFLVFNRKMINSLMKKFLRFNF